MAERDVGYGFRFPPSRLETLLGKGGIQTLPSGDVSLGHSESNVDGEELIVSPAGIQLVQEGFSVGPLLDRSRGPLFFNNPLHESYNGKIVKSSIVNRSGESIEVAVKKIEKGISYWREIDTTGIEQLMALRALEEAEVDTVKPLVATRNKLITVWSDNPIPDLEHENQRARFLEELEMLRYQLIASGRWKSEWRIDYGWSNYAINDLSSDNPLDWFTVIDPMGISF